MADLNRIRILAGMEDIKLNESKINEIVNKDELVDFDDVSRRLMHCKKALSLANSLPDPADRKKWKSAALANLNRVRAALARISKNIEQEISTVDE